MAIYSLHLGFISRSAGRTSVGFSAYVSADKLRDERTGQLYNFLDKVGVVEKGILAPEDAPAWVWDRCVLWNRVEQFEDDLAHDRFQGGEKSQEAKAKFLASTQTAQTIMGAIPLELSVNQAHACVREFLQERFVSRGLVVDYALHWDAGNPHFHGLIARRPLIDGTFSKRKDQGIVTWDAVQAIRKSWEVVANKHLALAGHEVRIDSRSHVDRGSLLLPTSHEGWHANQLGRQGKDSRIGLENEAIRQHNIEVLCANPVALIHEVASKRTVFTQKHLEEEIIRRVGGDVRLFEILHKRLQGINVSEDLIVQASNDNGLPKDLVLEGGFDAALQKAAALWARQALQDPTAVPVLVGAHPLYPNSYPHPQVSAYSHSENERLFTSAQVQEQASSIETCAQTLQERSTKIVPTSAVQKALADRSQELGFDLSPEQQAAVHHLCSGPDLRIFKVTP